MRSLPTTKGSPRLSRLLRAVAATVAAVATTIALATGASAAQPDHGARAHVSERPPEVSVTVLSRATLRGGAAILTGGVTCRHARHVRVHMRLRETVGGNRVVAYGHLRIRGQCDRRWHPWVMAVTPQNGRFTDGWAQWHAHATAFGRGHVHRSSSAAVQLSGSRG